MKSTSNLDNLSSSIFAVASVSTTLEFHSHKVSQLSIPNNGVVYLIIHDQLFIIPPGMAIFIPKNTKHKIVKINPQTMIENIYFANSYSRSLPQAPRSFHLSQLALSVISKICTFKQDQFNSKPVIHLIKVLLDELGQTSLLNYSLKISAHPKLVKIYELFVRSQDYYPSLEDAAKTINLTSRTLQRLFKQELRISFVLWKQQFMFIKAVELLQQNKSTSLTAYQLGYHSDSAFISMFKKMSGGKLPSEFY